MRRLLLLFLLCLFPIAGLATTPSKSQCPNLSFDQLVLVKRGGYWSQHKQHGFYRILVYRLGWDRTDDEILLQKMRFNNQKKRIDLLNCSVIPKPNKGKNFVKSLAIALFRDNRTLLTVFTYFPWVPGLTLRTVYIVTPKGNAVKIMHTLFNQSVLDQVYNREDL